MIRNRRKTYDFRITTVTGGCWVTNGFVFLTFLKFLKEPYYLLRKNFAIKRKCLKIGNLTRQQLANNTWDSG